MFRIWFAIFHALARMDFAIADKMGGTAAVASHFLIFWLLPFALVLIRSKAFNIAGISIALFYVFILVGDHFFSIFGHEELERRRGMMDIESVAEIREAIVGAILKYIGIIVSFTTVFNGLQDFSGGKAFAISHSSGFQYFDFIYYSVVTITTVGYGDILAVTWPAKLFAMTEIIFGLGYVLLLFTMLITVYVDIQKKKKESS
jgi:hypothetical protein